METSWSRRGTSDPTFQLSAGNLQRPCIPLHPLPQAYRRLQSLNAGSNSCNYTGPQIARLSGHRHLTYLVLHNPHSSTMPLRDLPSLVFLDLSGTRITALPTDPSVWASFPALQQLILSRTPLAVLPAAVAAAPLLKHIGLEGTPACEAQDSIPPQLRPAVQCPMALPQSTACAAPDTFPLGTQFDQSEVQACATLKAGGFPAFCKGRCHNTILEYWGLDRNGDGVVDEFEGVALYGGSATAEGVHNQEACLRSLWGCPLDGFDERSRGPSLALLLARELQGRTTCRECGAYYGNVTAERPARPKGDRPGRDGTGGRGGRGRRHG